LPEEQESGIDLHQYRFTDLGWPSLIAYLFYGLKIQDD